KTTLSCSRMSSPRALRVSTALCTDEAPGSHRHGSARVAADLTETLEHAVERLAAVLLAGRATVDAESHGRWPAVLVEPDSHARREPTQHVDLVGHVSSLSLDGDSPLGEPPVGEIIR